MANATQWEYNNENQARDVQKAFQIAAGLPTAGSYQPAKPGKRKGQTKRPNIPNSYTSGAPGWSAWVVDVEKTTGMGNTHAIQNAPECVPYYGMVVDIGPGPDITLPDASSAVARSGGWEVLPNPNGALAGSVKPRGPRGRK